MLNEIRTCRCALSSTRQMLVTTIITYLTTSPEDQYRLLMPWATCHSRTQVVWYHQHRSFWCLKIKPFSSASSRYPNFKINCTGSMTTHYLKPGAHGGGGGRRREKREKNGERRRLLTNCQCQSSSLKGPPYGEIKSTDSIFLTCSHKYISYKLVLIIVSSKSDQ